VFVLPIVTSFKVQFNRQVSVYNSGSRPGVREPPGIHGKISRVTWMQGRNEGAIPRAPSHYGGAKSLRGASNGCGGRRKVPSMSQVLSSIQHISFRKTSVSSMGARNVLLAPGAI